MYSGTTLLSILYPVALCMIFVAINIHLISPVRTDSPEVIIGLFPSYDSNLEGFTTWTIMAYLIFVTSLGVFCYIKKYYMVIQAYLVVNNFLLLAVYNLLNFRNIAEVYSIALSTPTSLFLNLQFAGLGILCLHWKSSKRLYQFYLIVLAALFAIFLLNKMPDWTVWIAIVGLCAYDILTVMTPCGPLKMLMDTAHRRGNDKFAVMIYKADTNDDSSDILSASSEVPVMQRTIRIGMGDFVFYSLMLGNTVRTCPFTTTVACFVSNLVGLAIIIPVAFHSHTALPALPFPLGMAAIFYFSSHNTLTPFANLCTSNLLFF